MEPKIAYVSAEFGLEEGLPLYAGGLGVLSGDILYQAAESRYPLAGITVFYRGGSFRQKIGSGGSQETFFESVDPEKAGLKDTGEIVKVPILDHDLALKIWRKDVGHPASRQPGGSVPLYLMDSNIEENRPRDRKITDQLYERVWAPHIIDDLVLGIGSVRLARALRIPIAVWHINDDHGTMNIFERIRERMAQGDSLEEARRKVKTETVFTTHTPVGAAESRFERDELISILTNLFKGIEVDLEKIWKLGERELGDRRVFSLTVFAMRHAREVNAVSKKHFGVSKKLWEFIGEDVPTAHVTNAVYSPRWAPPEKDKLEIKKRAAEEVKKISLDNQTFDPRALVMAWCRRFTGYKQPGLLLTDKGRLIRILTDPERPVYLLISGKAHPRDREGQEFLKRIVQAARDPEFGNHLIFIPDYSLAKAQSILAAADVWLNTPVVGMEASGTSGMKAVFNRALNAMTPDGWWPEGYNGKNGWVIKPRGEEYAGPLYELVEKEIVPTYYGDRERWEEMVEEALKSCGEKFDTPRMLGEYAKLYGITS